MDNQRLLVWATFGLLLWFTYQAWVQDHRPEPAGTSPKNTSDPLALPADDASLPALPDAPGDDGVDAPQIEATLPSIDEAATDAAVNSDSIVRVVTDVLELEINTKGGTIQRAIIRNYPVAKDRPDTLVELFSPTSTRTAMIQTGLRSAGDAAEPNHLVQFEAANTLYEMNGDDEIVVP